MINSRSNHCTDIGTHDPTIRRRPGLRSHHGANTDIPISMRELTVPSAAIIARPGRDFVSAAGADLSSANAHFA